MEIIPSVGLPIFGMLWPDFFRMALLAVLPSGASCEALMGTCWKLQDFLKIWVSVKIEGTVHIWEMLRDTQIFRHRQRVRYGKRGKWQDTREF